MITTDQELRTTLERITYFQRQVTHLRHVETNPVNYHLSVSGYLAELDRMNLEVREYLWCHPSEIKPRVSFQQGHSSKESRKPVMAVS